MQGRVPARKYKINFAMKFVFEGTDRLAKKEKGFTTEGTEEAHKGNGDGEVIWSLVRMADRLQGERKLNAEALSSEGPNKGEERRGCGFGSSEPTLRRQGWGTLKFLCLDGVTEDRRAQAGVPVPLLENRGQR
jgi:hypothetical protein